MELDSSLTKESNSLEDIASWTSTDVSAWLHEISLPQYAPLFLENHITGELLLELTNDDLAKDLQIPSFGHRKTILRAIESIRKRHKDGSDVSHPVLRGSTEKGTTEVEFQRKVAEGSFGSVWFGIWSSVEWYRVQWLTFGSAIKVISTSDIHPGILKRVKEEINILRNLHHRIPGGFCLAHFFLANIVKYLGHAEVLDKQELHLYMEFVPYSLHQLIQRRKQDNSGLDAVEVWVLSHGIAKVLVVGAAHLARGWSTCTTWRIL